jgi:hypothetical protein
MLAATTTLLPASARARCEELKAIRNRIAHLCKTMTIQISEKYHRVRLLELTADYLVKQEEAKDRIRAERERQKEAERNARKKRTRPAGLLVVESGLEYDDVVAVD